MAAFLAILIFSGFILLLISANKDKNPSNLSSSNSSGYPPTPNSSTLLQSASADSTSLISPPANRVVKADWDTSIFEEEALKVGTALYQKGIQVYKKHPNSASQYFKEAFDSIQNLSSKYSKNPIFYLNIVEYAMGFDYDVAITNGYEFFKLADHEDSTFEQMATIYDMSRKMYKILLLKEQFDEATHFSGKTMHTANIILEQTYDIGVNRERVIAEYFHHNLTAGNYGVQQNIIHGLAGPEPSWNFDIQQADDYFKKAVISLNLEQYSQAVSYSDRALKLNPLMFEAWNTKASAFQMSGKIKEAISAYLKGLKIEPDDEVITENLIGLIIINLFDNTEQNHLLFASFSEEEKGMINRLADTRNHPRRINVDANYENFEKEIQYLNRAIRENKYAFDRQILDPIFDELRKYDNFARANYDMPQLLREAKSDDSVLSLEERIENLNTYLGAALSTEMAMRILAIATGKVRRG